MAFHESLVDRAPDFQVGYHPSCAPATPRTTSKPGGRRAHWQRSLVEHGVDDAQL